MNGMQIAKAAIDGYSPNIGIGLGDTYAHIDVRGWAAVWNYGGATKAWVAEVKQYQRQKGGRSIAARASASAPSTGFPKPPQELVRFAQRVLNVTEGERLDADGSLGPKTRAALDRFAATHGIPMGSGISEQIQLALVQRALEELAQSSLFQKGKRDAATEQAIARFKTQRALGTDSSLDAVTRAALADAVEAGRLLPEVGVNDRRTFEREMAVLVPQDYQTPPAPAATGIALTTVKPTWSGETLVPELDAGSYTALFARPLPGAGNTRLRIAGTLLVADAQGVLVPAQAADIKRLKPKGAVARVGVGGRTGLASGTTGVVKVNATTGTFETETFLVSDGTTRRISAQVSIDLGDGSVAKAELVLERIDLEGFLSRVDAFEQKKPATQTHIEFLASVRKIYQGGPGSALQPLFDIVLFRHRNVLPLVQPGGADHRLLQRFQTLWVDGEYVDISHVLTGIEGSPRQEPYKGMSRGLKMKAPFDPELTVTWAGDLGSALASYVKQFMAAVATGQPVDISDELRRRASRADLLGDADGINVGAVYDPSRTLKQTLGGYYGNMSRKRFQAFVQNSRMSSSGRLLTLKPGTQRVTDDAKKQIAHQAKTFGGQSLVTTNFFNNLTTTEQKLVYSILDPTSPEMDLVVDHFVYFLENGLAREKP